MFFFLKLKLNAVDQKYTAVKSTIICTVIYFMRFLLFSSFFLIFNKMILFPFLSLFLPGTFNVTNSSVFSYKHEED